MLNDRRTTRWMNGICGAFAVAVVSMIAVAVRASDHEAFESRGVFNDRLHSLLDGAREAQKRGNAHGAETLYYEALSERPSSGLARLELAQLFEAQGQARKAREQYSVVVRPCLRSGAKPLGEADTLARYGDLCLKCGDEAEARKAFRLAALSPKASPFAGKSPFGFNIRSDRPRFFNFVGPPTELNLARSKAATATTAALSRIAERDDSTTKSLTAAAHLAAGRWCSMYRMGKTRTDEIFAHCRKAIASDPKNVLARCLLAIAAYDQGRKAEATAAMAQARALAYGDERADFERWAKVIEKLDRRKAAEHPG